MQNDLNILEVGPIFDATTNQAEVLALVFFAMTYAAGLPIAMPLMFVASGLYFWVDKLFLCRYFQRPPKLGNQVMVKVLDLLFIAVLLRISVACWMYGLLPISWHNPGGVSSYSSFNTAHPLSVSGQSYSSILNSIHSQLIDSYPLVTYLTDRMFKPNVFPMFVLLILLLVSTLMSYLFRFLYNTIPVFWVLEYLYNACCGKSKVYDASTLRQAKRGMVVNSYDLFRLHDPLRKSSAPLTGDYFQYIDATNRKGCCGSNFVQPHPSDMISDTQKAEGWVVNVLPDDIIVKEKQWVKSSTTRNLHISEHDTMLFTEELERKKTFEVIEEHACASYAIDEIPAYKTAALAIIESLGV